MRREVGRHPWTHSSCKPWPFLVEDVFFHCPSSPLGSHTALQAKAVHLALQHACGNLHLPSKYEQARGSHHAWCMCQLAADKSGIKQVLLG